MNFQSYFKTLLAMTILSVTSINSNAQEAKPQSTPAELVDALHTTFGNNHSRAVHAKGIILEGAFTPASTAASITKAFHFQKQKSKVILRFSDFTGIPDIPDNAGAANPRGIAIKFIMPDSSNTDIVGHSFNGFPTQNPTQFRDLLLAIAASGSGAVKPTALDKFLDENPVAKTFLTTQKTPRSYATINYFGVNSFKFTNKHGVSNYIRYQFIAEEGEQILTAEQITNAGNNYLVDEIKEHVLKQTIKFKLYAQIAKDGDVIEDPSIAWPSDRKMVLLGTIEIKKLAANTVEEDKALFFIPNNIPDGIETADPMLNFRSKAYPISVKERQ
ncbi:MAG: catalase family peroxidase [Ferruginibacter sp.]